MSVQEINLLHRRYVDLSDRFRAAWAFHQFVGSLHKILLGGEQPEYPVDFQEIYSDLKEVSQQLNASSRELVRGKLDGVDRQLARLTLALLAEDSRIEPSALRLFFTRVKNADSKILTQLAKFYLYSYEGAGWPVDRLDKLDFLVTRVAADRSSDGGVAADREATRELLKGLWQMVGAVEPAADLVTERCRSIREIRSEVEAVLDLDDLNTRQVVPRFREIKHCLGVLFFHPDVQMAILETNLKLGERIQELYQKEEQRLFTDYQRISDLEREMPADTELAGELADFRKEIESFEQRLGQQDLSLDELTRLRERMRTLLPRLARKRQEAESGMERTGSGLTSVGGPPVDAADRVEKWIRPYYERLVEALHDTSADESPRAVILKPEIFPFRLEPREVVAYRRRASGSGAEAEVERFILDAAALRVRLNEEMEEIRGLLDDTATTGQAPIFGQARESTRLADRYLRRFGHYLEQAVLAGDLEEARSLQHLRMRFMREHASLWLLAHKPILNRQH